MVVKHGLTQECIQNGGLETSWKAENKVGGY
jgi:hypothetical protein